MRSDHVNGKLHVLAASSAAAQTVEILRLDGATYRIVQVANGEACIRAEPFDAIELDLKALWQR